MNLENTNCKWHALYVSSRSEKKVYNTLTQNNVQAFVPIVKTMRQWSDRKKIVEIPLINGYVFVNINSKQKDSVLQTQGVVNYVYFDGKHAVIRDNEIETLKQIALTGYETNLDNNVVFNVNDKVIINQGPLKGLECYVIGIINNETIIAYTVASIKQTMTIKLPKAIFLHTK